MREKARSCDEILFFDAGTERQRQKSMSDILARNMIFWATVKLEDRRGALCEWSYLSSHIGSEGDRRKVMFLLIEYEAFGEGGIDLERTSV